MALPMGMTKCGGGGLLWVALSRKYMWNKWIKKKISGLTSGSKEA